MRKKILKQFALIFSLLAFAIHVGAQTPAKRPMSVNDLQSIRRVSEPQISPDGKWVVYTIGTPDLAANSVVNEVWLVPTDGGDARQLTRGGNNSRPQWSPDGTRIAFLSDRAGVTQVYVVAVAGGDPELLTTLSTGADNEQWSPDGRSIAFTSSVFPNCADDACNAARVHARDVNPVKAREYDTLLFRHWVRWSDGTRSHLFVADAQSGQARDLTPAADYDVPPDQRGDPTDIAWSPDSKQICFTAVTDRPEAISTNGDLFVVDLAGGAPKRITTNPGFDGHPTYSPDGRSIAYRSQATPEYESDLWRLMLYDRASGTSARLAPNFDLWVDTILWSPDSKNLYFWAQQEIEQPVFEVAATPDAEPRAIVGGFNDNVTFSADGSTMAILRSAQNAPTEVWAARSDGSDLRQLTHENAPLLAQLDLARPETFWFAGAGGTRVEGILIRPPSFDPSKKYPVVLVIHGGPQAGWEDAWESQAYRWNAQLFAAPGYVAVLINPRGSTGYGQKFVDEIQDDWGGRPYEDLMKGLDYVLATYPFTDGSRTAAIGGSYGGYMVDWIATRTDRFKCLISHAGPYDEFSMYGSTEELWFVEHDLKGTPWTNPASYQNWSPSTYAAALGKYKTPTLILAGELDYRVPYTQDLEFFTALQRQGVPSKILLFPDEGHWIQKPLNSERWNDAVADWLATYLK
ncbi:MAG: S9 family peptidase [Candidatus Acidiferrales bacterium]